MAVFNQDYAGNINTLDSVEKIREYLNRQSDQLRYMFENLTVQDNFSPSARAEYESMKERE